MHEVLFLPSAARDVSKLPADDRERLRRAVMPLSSWPNHGRDVRRLHGMELAQFRLRVGDYRVLFDVDPAAQRILIIRIRRRDRAYE
jgi:mRNA interferase RelE/StbE